MNILKEQLSVIDSGSTLHIATEKTGLHLRELDKKVSVDITAFDGSTNSSIRSGCAVGYKEWNEDRD